MYRLSILLTYFSCICLLVSTEEEVSRSQQRRRQQGRQRKLRKKQWTTTPPPTTTVSLKKEEPLDETWPWSNQWFKSPHRQLQNSDHIDYDYYDAQIPYDQEDEDILDLEDEYPADRDIHIIPQALFEGGGTVPPLVKTLFDEGEDEGDEAQMASTDLATFEILEFAERTSPDALSTTEMATDTSMTIQDESSTWAYTSSTEWSSTWDFSSSTASAGETAVCEANSSSTELISTENLNELDISTFESTQWSSTYSDVMETSSPLSESTLENAMRDDTSTSWLTQSFESAATFTTESSADSATAVAEGGFSSHADEDIVSSKAFSDSTIAIHEDESTAPASEESQSTQTETLSAGILDFTELEYDAFTTYEDGTDLYHSTTESPLKLTMQTDESTSANAADGSSLDQTYSDDINIDLSTAQTLQTDQSYYLPDSTIDHQDESTSMLDPSPTRAPESTSSEPDDSATTLNESTVEAGQEETTVEAEKDESTAEADEDESTAKADEDESTGEADEDESTGEADEDESTAEADEDESTAEAEGDESTAEAEGDESTDEVQSGKSTAEADDDESTDEVQSGESTVEADENESTAESDVGSSTVRGEKDAMSSTFEPQSEFTSLEDSTTEAPNCSAFYDETSTTFEQISGAALTTYGDVMTDESLSTTETNNSADGTINGDSTQSTVFDEQSTTEVITGTEASTEALDPSAALSTDDLTSTEGFITEQIFTSDLSSALGDPIFSSQTESTMIEESTFLQESSEGATENTNPEITTLLSDSTALSTETLLEGSSWPSEALSTVSEDLSSATTEMLSSEAISETSHYSSRETVTATESTVPSYGTESSTEAIDGSTETATEFVSTFASEVSTEDTSPNSTEYTASTDLYEDETTVPESSTFAESSILIGQQTDSSTESASEYTVEATSAPCEEKSFETSEGDYSTLMTNTESEGVMATVLSHSTYPETSTEIETTEIVVQKKRALDFIPYEENLDMFPLEVMVEEKDLQALGGAVKANPKYEVLRKIGMTLFAPVDKAFEGLPIDINSLGSSPTALKKRVGFDANSDLNRELRAGQRDLRSSGPGRKLHESVECDPYDGCEHLPGRAFDGVGEDPAPKDILADFEKLIMYHVVKRISPPGMLEARKQLLLKTEMKGRNLEVVVDLVKKEVIVGGQAKVVGIIACRNGFIYKLDRPLFPAWNLNRPNILEFIRSNPHYTRLSFLMEESGLFDDWSLAGPVTLLLIPDSAWRLDGVTIPPCFFKALARPENAAILSKLLKWTTIPGLWTKADIQRSQWLPNGAAPSLTVSTIDMQRWNASQAKRAKIYYNRDKLVEPYVRWPHDPEQPHLNEEIDEASYSEDDFSPPTLIEGKEVIAWDIQFYNGFGHAISELPLRPDIDLKAMVWDCLDMFCHECPIVTKFLLKYLDGGGLLPDTNNPKAYMVPPGVRPDWVCSGAELKWFPPGWDSREWFKYLDIAKSGNARFAHQTALNGWRKAAVRMAELEDKLEEAEVHLRQIWKYYGNSADYVLGEKEDPNLLLGWLRNKRSLDYKPRICDPKVPHRPGVMIDTDDIWDGAESWSSSMVSPQRKQFMSVMERDRNLRFGMEDLRHILSPV